MPSIGIVKHTSAIKASSVALCVKSTNANTLAAIISIM